VNVLSIQNSQKERCFHENEHDWRHKYDEMLNQDNDNQDEMSYILRTHMEKNGNPICEHGMDEKMEKRHPKVRRKWSERCFVHEYEDRLTDDEY